MSEDLELEGSHADWLGGAFGAREEIKLPARCKELLQFALDNGILMDDTIPEDGVVLSKDEYKTLEDLFVGGLKDACGESKRPPRSSEEVLLRAWLAVQYKKKDVSSSGDGTVQDRTVSAEQQAVLDAQGMKDLADLAGFELCFALGRPVAVDECKGFSFGAPPDGMAGAVLQRKNKLSNLDEKIEKARESGDPVPVDTHFERLTAALLESNLMPYNSKGANRIQTFHSRSKQNISSVVARMIYYQIVRQKRQGQGLPDGLFDSEACIRANNMAQAAAVQKGLPLSLAGLGSLAGGSDTASMISSGDATRRSRRMSELRWNNGDGSSPPPQ